MSQPNALKSACRMTRGELIFGWIYIPFYLIGIAWLLVAGAELLHRELSDSVLNLIYCYINFFAIAIGFRRFLGESLKRLQVLQLLKNLLLAFGVFYLCSLLLSLLVSLLPEYTNPADATTTELIHGERNQMSVCAIFLAPLVEEILVRGLIFAPLARKNRLLGYAVSVLAFSALHLWGYVGSVKVPVLLLAMLDYVPGGVALAFSYERSGNIWAPIALHMLINALSVWAITLI